MTNEQSTQPNIEWLTDTLYLQRDETGLSLRDGRLVVQGDFREMLPRLKENNLRGEMLVKAARVKGLDRPIVVDATAGLGEDSILLAAAGFEVYLYEYDRVIADLLEDALARAAELPELSTIVARMHLRKENSVEALCHLDFEPDVVYLDPMFPERAKTGLIKKKFQLLQQLESPCSDEADLMNAAIAAHPHKIVIKRPLKGPVLAGVKPSYSHEGKAIRYDCIVYAK